MKLCCPITRDIHGSTMKLEGPCLHGPWGLNPTLWLPHRTELLGFSLLFVSGVNPAGDRSSRGAERPLAE